jgi:pyruvate-formate lyase-activating enzyme
MPYILFIDLTNICNLKCDYCPTGQKKYGRKPGYVDLDHIKKLLNDLGKYLYMAHLFSWGEPLLHPKIKDIITLVHSHRILTNISTNLNTGNKAILGDICDSGLDYLVLSIDGNSQDVYAKYRIGGNLSLVLDNIRYLVDYKQKNNLKTPVIEWQYLIFDHNRHEVESAGKTAKRLGVDIFSALPGIVPDKYKAAWSGNRLCPFLWDSIALQVDGGISACCNLIDAGDDFGHVSYGSFRDIWHEARHETARTLFSPKLTHTLSDDLMHPCMNCSLVKIQPHLSSFLKRHKNTRSPDQNEGQKDDSIAVRSGLDK